MAHYALIDEIGIVVDVITGVDENDKSNLPKEFDSWEAFYKDLEGAADCKRTSYNTSAGEHSKGGTAFRANFAGLGYKYDSTNDVFIPPKPENSEKTYELDESMWIWVEKE